MAKDRKTCLIPINLKKDKNAKYMLCLFHNIRIVVVKRSGHCREVKRRVDAWNVSQEAKVAATER